MIPHRWPFYVAALAAVMFFRMLGVFLLLPVVTAAAGTNAAGGDLLANAPGWQLGLLISGYGITQACLQIPLGALSDRYGRKPVLLAALLLFAGGSFYAAAAETMTQLLIGRFLQGAAAIAAVSTAWIMDIAPPHARARAIAGFGVAVGLAFVLSLLLAPPLFARIGIFKMFGFIGVLALISLVLLVLLPPPHQKTERTENTDSPLTVLKNVPLRRYAVGAFVLHYALAALFFLMPPILSMHRPVGEHTHIYALSFAVSLLISLPLLAKADKHPAVFVIAVALLLAGFLWLPAMPPIAGAGAALVLFFGGFVVLEAVLPARAGRCHTQRGTAMGVVFTLEFLGIFAGGLLTGFFNQYLGGRIAAVITCIIITLWLVMNYRMLFNKRRTVYGE